MQHVRKRETEQAQNACGPQGRSDIRGRMEKARASLRLPSSSMGFSQPKRKARKAKGETDSRGISHWAEMSRL